MLASDGAMGLKMSVPRRDDGVFFDDDVGARGGRLCKEEGLGVLRRGKAIGEKGNEYRKLEIKKRQRVGGGQP